MSEDSNGIPLLRGINITEGFIRHSVEIDRYFHGSKEGLDKFVLREGDLVIGMDGSKVGKNSARITAKDAGALLVQRIARLRSDDNSLLEYIFQKIKSSDFHEYVDRVNTSGGIPHISLKQIEAYRIPFPSSNTELQKIASCLSAADEYITAQAEKIAQLKLHKQRLMQGLFPKIKDSKNKVFSI